jgi:TPR repeat protein
MNLSYVVIECSDCGMCRYISACQFSFATRKQLNDHTAALIPNILECDCGSKSLSIKYPNTDRDIVSANTIRFCTSCTSAIPNIFRISFPEADFCPLCVQEKKIEENRIVQASGDLFKGEAFWKMSSQFEYKSDAYLYWLNKAALEDHARSCFKLADHLIKSESNEADNQAAALYEKGLLWENGAESLRGAQYRLGILHLYKKIDHSNLNYGIDLLKKSMENGAPYAADHLGQIYLYGLDDIKKNKKYAFECFENSYTMNPDSIINNSIMGFLYLYGEGCKKNKQQSFAFLSKALSSRMKDEPSSLVELAKSELSVVIEHGKIALENVKISKPYFNFLAQSQSFPFKESLNSFALPHQEPLPPDATLLLKSVLPREAKRWVWDVYDTKADFYIHKPPLGQIEAVEKGRWICSTLEGQPLEPNFSTQKAAAEALASSKGSSSKYVNILDQINVVKS